MLTSILLVGCLATLAHAQSDLWLDPFQKELCHHRWMQMDWQSILRPCRSNIEFGRNTMEEKIRTSPKYSHTTGLHFKKTGEFSKITIQSRTSDGTIKRSGGDTWRVFIRGNQGAKLTPPVADLNNGVYESKFMLMEPGRYKADIALESSLCESYKDPPQDWLKRDAATIMGDEKHGKLVWQPLRGGNISFIIEPNTKEHMNSLQRNFYKFKDRCGPQYKCDMLWNGVGRWVNSTWKPYVDESYQPNEDMTEVRCLKEKEGMLHFTGDTFTRDFFNYTQAVRGGLCGGVFEQCEGPSTGEQPLDEPNSYQRDDTQPNKHTFSTKSYTKALKALVSRPRMDENSGLFLSYGAPFAKNMNFKQYRSFIDRAARILKEKYKGKAVWKTTTSQWHDSDAPEDHFKNHQREMLFNAYATSQMCAVGIPTIDITQMTEAEPFMKKDEVYSFVDKLVTDYFRNRPTVRNHCHRRSEEGSGSGDEQTDEQTDQQSAEQTAAHQLAQQTAFAAGQEAAAAVASMPVAVAARTAATLFQSDAVVDPVAERLLEGMQRAGVLR